MTSFTAWSFLCVHLKAISATYAVWWSYTFLSNINSCQLTRMICSSLSLWRSSFSRSATFIIVSFSTSSSFSVTWERRQTEMRDGEFTNRSTASLSNDVHHQQEIWASWRGSRSMTQHFVNRLQTPHRNSSPSTSSIIPGPWEESLLWNSSSDVRGCPRPFPCEGGLLQSTVGCRGSGPIREQY